MCPSRPVSIGEGRAASTGEGVTVSSNRTPQILIDVPVAGVWLVQKRAMVCGAHLAFRPFWHERRMIYG